MIEKTNRMFIVPIKENIIGNRFFVMQLFQASRSRLISYTLLWNKR